MPRLLITFSGVVGSGKSTNAKRVRDLLQKQGLDVAYLRFRQVNWKWLYRPQPRKAGNRFSSPKKSASNRAPVDGKLRKGRIAPLRFVRFWGYLMRMFVFRAVLYLHHREKVVITDRYYYDNFGHYELIGPLERLYLKILKWAMPQPDLAIMLTADVPQLIQRRKQYDPDFLHRMQKRYHALLQEFPELIPVGTSRLEQVDEQIEGILQKFLNQCTSLGSGEEMQAEKSEGS